MTIRAQIEGIGTLEFPDDTPQDVIDRTVQQEIQRMKVSSAVDQGKRDLANSLPWYEAAMIGAGKGADSMWAGLKQTGIGMAGLAANALPDSGVKRNLEDFVTRKAGDLEKRQREQTAEYSVLAKERPIVTGLGEGASTFAIPAGATVKGAKGIAEILGGAALQGAIPGVLGFGTPQERAASAASGAAGGAVGGAVGAGVSRVIQPFREAEQTAVKQAALKAADELGLKLTPAEITGNRALKWMQASMDDLPLSSAIGTARREANLRALDRAVLKDLGEEGATQITDKVRGAARERIGGIYDDVFKNARVAVPDETLSKLSSISDEAMRFLPKDQARVVVNRIDDLLGKVEADGALPGIAYQKWRSSASSTSGDVNLYLKQARAVVDDAAKAALSSEKMDSFALANKQWATLKALNSGNVVNRETGHISPKALDNYLASRYKDAYKEGRIDGNLAKVAKTAGLLREMPNSGSVPRAVYSGGVGGAAFVEPMTAVTMAGAPLAGQLALNNPLTRAYLRNGMFGITPEMERLLIRGGAGAGAGGGLALQLGLSQ